MKRLIIILGLLGLLFDLGDDCFIGQVKMVAPGCPSASAQQQADDESSNTFYGKITAISPRPSSLVDLCGDYHYRLAAVEDFHPRTIIYTCHFCSSGGIPL